ncbi:hypothetical protein [Beijerinckia sp. L45]|uniref:hypothetical protein n=1 Tax=Beijerinckia sp. L45 TaxID=1641855 RepID=UPI001FF04E2E|nr:hypothetical protein [Beijerinckia sp. L45]
MDVKTGFAAIGFGLLAVAPAAQAQIVSGSGQTIPEKDTTRSPDALKAQQAPSTIQDGRSDSLSSKLNQSGGVIRPKGDVDPGMNTPAPVDHPNSTPVIPPSATGGENAK